MTGTDVTEALLFDFDGLILDTESSDYQTVRDEFELHGVELPFAAWQAIIGSVDHPHWLDWLEDELGRPLEDREAIRSRRIASHHELIVASAVLPGVPELLDAAATAGVPCGVASSSSSSWVEGHLERIGLRYRFAVVRTRDHVDRGKPWPDVYLAAADALGVRPTGCVALEDSHNGSLAAKAAGMRCIVVPNPMTRGQDFSHADLVVDSLAAVSLAQVLGAGGRAGSGAPRADVVRDVAH